MLKEYSFWSIIFWCAILVVIFAVSGLIADEIRARMTPKGRRILAMALLLAVVLVITIGISLGY